MWYTSLPEKQVSYSVPSSCTASGTSTSADEKTSFPSPSGSNTVMSPVNQSYDDFSEEAQMMKYVSNIMHMLQCSDDDGSDTSSPAMMQGMNGNILGDNSVLFANAFSPNSNHAASPPITTTSTTSTASHTSVWATDKRTPSGSATSGNSNAAIRKSAAPLYQPPTSRAGAKQAIQKSKPESATASHAPSEKSTSSLPEMKVSDPGAQQQQPAVSVPQETNGAPPANRWSALSPATTNQPNSTQITSLPPPNRLAATQGNVPSTPPSIQVGVSARNGFPSVPSGISIDIPAQPGSIPSVHVQPPTNIQVGVSAAPPRGGPSPRVSPINPTAPKVSITIGKRPLTPPGSKTNPNNGNSSSNLPTTINNATPLSNAASSVHKNTYLDPTASGWHVPTSADGGDSNDLCVQSTSNKGNGTTIIFGSMSNATDPLSLSNSQQSSPPPHHQYQNAFAQNGSRAPETTPMASPTINQGATSYPQDHSSAQNNDKSGPTVPPGYCTVQCNGQSVVVPLEVLAIINGLNKDSHNNTGNEGESISRPSPEVLASLKKLQQQTQQPLPPQQAQPTYPQPHYQQQQQQQQQQYQQGHDLRGLSDLSSSAGIQYPAHPSSMMNPSMNAGGVRPPLSGQNVPPGFPYQQAPFLNQRNGGAGMPPPSPPQQQQQQSNGLAFPPNSSSSLSQQQQQQQQLQIATLLHLIQLQSRGDSSVGQNRNSLNMNGGGIPNGISPFLNQMSPPMPSLQHEHSSPTPNDSDEQSRTARALLSSVLAQMYASNNGGQSTSQQQQQQQMKMPQPHIQMPMSQQQQQQQQNYRGPVQPQRQPQQQQQQQTTLPKGPQTQNLGTAGGGGGGGLSQEYLLRVVQAVLQSQNAAAPKSFSSTPPAMGMNQGLNLNFGGANSNGVADRPNLPSQYLLNQMNAAAQFGGAQPGIGNASNGSANNMLYNPTGSSNGNVQFNPRAYPGGLPNSATNNGQNNGPFSLPMGQSNGNNNGPLSGANGLPSSYSKPMQNGSAPSQGRPQQQQQQQLPQSGNSSSASTLNGPQPFVFLGPDGQQVFAMLHP